MFKLIPLVLSVFLAGGAAVATQDSLHRDMRANAVSPTSLQSTVNAKSQDSQAQADGPAQSHDEKEEHLNIQTNTSISQEGFISIMH